MCSWSQLIAQVLHSLVYYFTLAKYITLILFHIKQQTKNQAVIVKVVSSYISFDPKFSKGEQGWAQKWTQSLTEGFKYTKYI